MSEPMDSTFLAKIRRLDFNAFKDRVEDTIKFKSPPFQPTPVAPVTQEIYKDHFRLSEEKARAVADVAHYKSVITVFQSKIDEKDASIQSLNGTLTSLKDECKALNSQLHDTRSREWAALGLTQETQTRLSGVEGDLRNSNAKIASLEAYKEYLCKKHHTEMEDFRAAYRAEKDVSTRRKQAFIEANDNNIELQKKLDANKNTLEEEKAKVSQLSFEKRMADNKRAKVATDLAVAVDELDGVKARLARETAERVRLQAELQVALDVIAQQKKLIEEKDGALLRMQDEMEAVKEKSASDYEELRTRFEVAEDQIAGMRGEMAALYTDLATATALVDSMTVELGDKNVELQRLSQDVDQHKAQIEVLRVDATAKEKELGETRDELKGVEGQLERAHTDCANLNALLTEKDARIDVAMERCKSIEGEFAAYREKAEKDAQDIVESLHQQIRVLQGEKDDALTQLSSVRLELDDTKTQLVNANKHNLSLSDELLEQKDTLEDTKAELSKVQVFFNTASNDLREEKVSHRASITVAEVDKAELSKKVSERDEIIARLSKDKEVADQEIVQLTKNMEVSAKRLSVVEANCERMRTDFATLEEKFRKCENVRSTPAHTTLPTPAPTPAPTPPPVVASLPSTPTKTESKNPPTPVSNTRPRAPQIQSQFIRTLVLNQAKSNNNQSGVIPQGKRNH
ncbi:hypothetical protein NLI96_g4666 [Meripilus lineatus]|uniref:Uncharacterized protein n=1 Tax=Meripilus lineatus TaxID=2056292 RepID=A0AAD5YEK0_9APHY|nr:hypothetical protein NLI96_g4666 [Physisporinus lineatus]